MTVQTITATEAARAFSELLNQICYEHQSFVIVRGGERVAQLEPATLPTAPLGSELDRLLVETVPQLGAEEAASFRVEVLNARAQLTGLERKWD